MKLYYRTERLPLNFIILGYLLSAIGVWRIIVFDWKGILFLLLSFFLIFLQSGIIIDADKKLLKKYTGILFIKKGKWQNINQLTGLQIVKLKETQTMNVLSISRTDTDDTCKVYLNMPDRKIFLMKGSDIEMNNKAKEIVSLLHTSVLVDNE